MTSQEDRHFEQIRKLDAEVAELREKLRRYDKSACEAAAKAMGGKPYACWHKNTRSIHPDEYGNLYECKDCGMRTGNPASELWRKPGVLIYPDDPFGKRLGD